MQRTGTCGGHSPWGSSPTLGGTQLVGVGDPDRAGVHPASQPMSPLVQGSMVRQVQWPLADGFVADAAYWTFPGVSQWVGVWQDAGEAQRQVRT